MKTFLYILIGMLIPFAMAAFINWKINPGEWDMGARFFASFLSVIFGFWAYLLISINKG
jgi:hypothetical protein